MSTPTRRDDAVHYLWGQGCDGWHLHRAPDLGVIAERVPPGAGEVAHLHVHAQQFFYVLAGRATLTVGEAVHALGPGEGCHVPAGVAHRLHNHGEVALEFLVVSTPHAHGDRVIVEE